MWSQAKGASLWPHFDSGCWRSDIIRPLRFAYLHSVAEFARHFHKPPNQLGPEQIRQYQLFLIKDKQASQSTCVQLVCALRFLYTHTLRHKIEIERIPFPRRERKLPLILSRDEVKALLQAPAKLRDRAVSAALYGCGGPRLEHELHCQHDRARVAAENQRRLWKERASYVYER
jgi:site-specific recombinase XerC